ncbi:MAG: hypothetical protein ACPHUK_03250, partial [Candidatus Poseidoniaceae archaeon]
LLRSRQVIADDVCDGIMQHGEIPVGQPLERRAPEAIVVVEIEEALLEATRDAMNSGASWGVGCSTTRNNT